jgi:hypothetical protein
MYFPLRLVFDDDIINLALLGPEECSLLHTYKDVELFINKAVEPRYVNHCENNAASQ